MKNQRIYSHYFNRFNESAFNSNLGLSLQECCYAVDKYCGQRTGVSCLDFLMALHFAWKYPEGHYGGTIWKMCRQKHSEKVWRTLSIVEAFMDEIKFENRLKSAIFMDGPDAYCSMHTDSSDFMINRPSDSAEAKKHYTYKRRKFAMRYAIAVAANTGDVCWLSSGHPAGSISDLNINRREGLVEGLQFFERVGADGAYLCRRDPMYKCPHRKPRGGELTEQQIRENDAFGNYRSIVENVFARVKQFACMTRWRHNRERHSIVARFVFQLIQIKQKFRPIRRLGLSKKEHEELAAANWRAAELHGVPAIVPEAKRTRRRPRERKNQPRLGRRRKAARIARMPRGEIKIGSGSGDDADEADASCNSYIQPGDPLSSDTDSGSSGREIANDTAVETDYGISEDRIKATRGRAPRMAKVGALLGMRAASLHGEKVDRLMRRKARRNRRKT